MDDLFLSFFAYIEFLVSQVMDTVDTGKVRYTIYSSEIRKCADG